MGGGDGACRLRARRADRLLGGARRLRPAELDLDLQHRRGALSGPNQVARLLRRMALAALREAGPATGEAPGAHFLRASAFALLRASAFALLRASAFALLRPSAIAFFQASAFARVFWILARVVR